MHTNTTTPWTSTNKNSLKPSPTFYIHIYGNDVLMGAQQVKCWDAFNGNIRDFRSPHADRGWFYFSHTSYVCNLLFRFWQLTLWEVFTSDLLVHQRNWDIFIILCFRVLELVEEVLDLCLCKKQALQVPRWRPVTATVASHNVTLWMPSALDVTVMPTPTIRHLWSTIWGTCLAA